MICALRMVRHAQQVIDASSSSCLLAHDASLMQERLGQLGKHIAEKNMVLLSAVVDPAHPGGGNYHKPRPAARETGCS